MAVCQGFVFYATCLAATAQYETCGNWDVHKDWNKSWLGGFRTLDLSVMFYNFMFPQTFRGKGVSLLILGLRVFFGVMFFTHALDKMENFEQLSLTFPNILGFGSYMSLMLIIFVEFCCSLFLIAGLMVRITVIPMMIAMAVAFFDVHDGMFPAGELSLIYLIMFIILYITGPGKFSIDFLIDRKIQKARNG